MARTETLPEAKSVMERLPRADPSLRRNPTAAEQAAFEKAVDAEQARYQPPSNAPSRPAPADPQPPVPGPNEQERRRADVSGWTPPPMGEAVTEWVPPPGLP